MDQVDLFQLDSRYEFDAPQFVDFGANEESNAVEDWFKNHQSSPSRAAQLLLLSPLPSKLSSDTIALEQVMQNKGSGKKQQLKSNVLKSSNKANQQPHQSQAQHSLLKTALKNQLPRKLVLEPIGKENATTTNQEKKFQAPVVAPTPKVPSKAKVAPTIAKTPQFATTKRSETRAQTTQPIQKEDETQVIEMITQAKKKIKLQKQLEKQPAVISYIPNNVAQQQHQQQPHHQEPIAKPQPTKPVEFNFHIDQRKKFQQTVQQAHSQQQQAEHQLQQQHQQQQYQQQPQQQQHQELTRIIQQLPPMKMTSPHPFHFQTDNRVQRKQLFAPLDDHMKPHINFKKGQSEIQKIWRESLAKTILRVNKPRMTLGEVNDSILYGPPKGIPSIPPTKLTTPYSPKFKTKERTKLDQAWQQSNNNSNRMSNFPKSKQSMAANSKQSIAPTTMMGKKSMAPTNTSTTMIGKKSIAPSSKQSFAPKQSYAPRQSTLSAPNQSYAPRQSTAQQTKPAVTAPAPFKFATEERGIQREQLQQQIQEFNRSGAYEQDHRQLLLSIGRSLKPKHISKALNSTSNRKSYCKYPGTPFTPKTSSTHY